MRLNNIFQIVISLSFILIVTSLPVSSLESYSLEYDSNGNLIQGKDNYYEYNDFNQLSKVRDSTGRLIYEYFYDYKGDRIKKIEHLNSETITTYYIGNLVREVKNADRFNLPKIKDTIYYSLDGTLVGQEDSTGKKFYHPDHIGSTSLVTDENGLSVDSVSYLPFGGILEGGNERYLFTGKEQEDNGLYYYGARYYDPWLRKFIQPDGVIQDIYNPQNLNRYSYVLNNPYKYTDSTGNYIETVFDIGFIIYDINELRNDFNLVNSLSLGADVAGALLPFATGLGLGVRTFSKVNDVWKIEKGADKVKDVGKISAGANGANKIPINKLYGHATDNPSNLFRKGAKDHNKFPIDVVEIGDKYMISDGVGRSMRALKAGEKSINANVIRSYSSVDNLNKLSVTEDIAKVDRHWWDNLVSKIDSPKRWRKLFGK